MTLWTIQLQWTLGAITAKSMILHICLKIQNSCTAFGHRWDGRKANYFFGGVGLTESRNWSRVPGRASFDRPCVEWPLPVCALQQQCPGGGGWVGLGWVKASPGRLPTVRAAFPAGPDWAAVPGCPVTRPTGLLTAPRPRGGARGREMPPCLCVCALVCLRGGGGLWHTCLLHCCSALAHMARGSVCLVLQAPAGRLESLTLSPPGEMWAWARNLHVTRTCYPTTPRLPIGTGRRWYVARLGSDPHSLTALGTGGAASRAGSGSHGRGRTLGRWRGTKAQSVLPCPGCHQCWLHWLRRYSPRRRGGPEGTTPEWPLR